MTDKSENTAQPQFYRKPEPLDFNRHKELGVDSTASFAFAQNAHVVMVTAPEIALASRSYPVVFTAGNDPMPVAILGIRDRENLFVRDGNWTAHTYIPAYIRRYPFAFLESEDKSSLILCVDTESDAVRKNTATGFFYANGEPSDFTRRALDFCKSFQIQFNVTRQLSELVKKHDLLVSRQADITIQNGEKLAVRDFLVVDEEKLNGLSDESYLELRKAGILPTLYFHLMSLSNFKDLAERSLANRAESAIRT